MLYICYIYDISRSSILRLGQKLRVFILNRVTQSDR